jgi:CheY-like chemotaxis protein
LEQQHRQDKPSLEPPTALAGLRVFVAEDEPMILWALEDHLGELKCKVVGTAARVTEALAFVASHSFDIAVLDGTLADGSIAPVIDALVVRGTPFILATGLVSSDYSETFSSVVVLQKPYTVVDLRQALLLALAQGPAQRRPRL